MKVYQICAAKITFTKRPKFRIPLIINFANNTNILHFSVNKST